MARRRLQTILATTVLAAGLSTVPAWAGPGLGDLTDPVEETVTEATEDVVDTATETVTGDTTSEPTPEPTDTASEGDDSTIDVGTDDGTLDVDLDVDIAPSDEDGSPQLEIDGGATIADQDVDLGSVTDPIEDAVDPDPAPNPSPSPESDGDTSSDTTDENTTESRSGGSGGFLSGGGVVAAGDGARPFGTPQDSDGTPRGSALGQGFAAFGALDRGSFGAQRYGGGTMALDRVPDPEVAPPLYESPQIADPTPLEVQQAETPVLANGMSPDGSEGPMSAMLRALAAAMVLGTGVVWTRATRKV